MLGIQRSCKLSLSSDVERIIRRGDVELNSLRDFPWPAGPTGVCDLAAEADVARLYFQLRTLIDVILKPLTELPPNFEIGYADEDSCCSVDVAGISAWGITASINIIGVAAGVMNGTIEWLNLSQSWTQGQWTHLPF